LLAACQVQATIILLAFGFELPIDLINYMQARATQSSSASVEAEEGNPNSESSRKSKDRLESMLKTKKKKTLEELKFFHFVRKNVYAQKLFWKNFHYINIEFVKCSWSNSNLILFDDSTEVVS